MVAKKSAPEPAPNEFDRYARGYANQRGETTPSTTYQYYLPSTPSNSLGIVPGTTTVPSIGTTSTPNCIFNVNEQTNHCY